MTQCTSYAASTANKHKTEEIHRHKTGNTRYRSNNRRNIGAKRKIQMQNRRNTGEIHVQNRVNTGAKQSNTGAKIPNKL